MFKFASELPACIFCALLAGCFIGWMLSTSYHGLSFAAASAIGALVCFAVVALAQNGYASAHKHEASEGSL